MQVAEELARILPEKDMLLAIGVFDGVHLGHKYLISELVAQASQQNLLSGVITFHQHPQEVVSPEGRLLFLTDLKGRSQLLSNEGVAVVIPLSFTTELANLSARQFASLLQKHLRMRGLVVGTDFALGKNREGDINTLQQLGEEMDFSVAVVAPVMVNGEVVSSTAVRKALADGDMGKVYRLTGRSFNLSGNVVAGTGRGVELGFPTANLDISREQALPADGVYAGWAYIDGKTYQAMTNIGRKPTFGNGDRTVEAYVIDYNDDLYGRQLKVDIIERLRDEKKFDSVEALKEQVAEDVRQGKAILSSKSAV